MSAAPTGSLYRLVPDSLYYPAMYRDAGIADAYQFRNAVMADPGRQSHHDAMTAKVRKFFAKIGAA